MPTTTTCCTGGVDLDQVDTGDGEKIVRNVFGSNEEAVVNQLGGIGGLDAGMIAKLLPMLAPLVMSFLAKLRGGGGALAEAVTVVAADSVTCSEAVARRWWWRRRRWPRRAVPRRRR